MCDALLGVLSFFCFRFTIVWLSIDTSVFKPLFTHVLNALNILPAISVHNIYTSEQCLSLWNVHGWLRMTKLEAIFLACGQAFLVVPTFRIFCPLFFSYIYILKMCAHGFPLILRSETSGFCIIKKKKKRKKGIPIVYIQYVQPKLIDVIILVINF